MSVDAQNFMCSGVDNEQAGCFSCTKLGYVFLIFIFVIMNADLNVNDILLQVKHLDKEDQLSLLEKLVLLIRKSERKGNITKLSSISGVGSSLWSNTDIDKYIDQERQW